MKTRLKITVDDKILAQVKHYAAEKHISVSQIIEGHFRSLVKVSVKKTGILAAMDELDAPSNIDHETDLKKAFYEDQSEKY